MYQRMQLWMDTRATYGNNPYYKEKRVKQAGIRKEKSSISKKPRSLFEIQDNLELLKQLEDFTAAQGLVDESGGASQADWGVVIEQEDASHGVIEDGEVTVDMEKYNQVMMDMDQMANHEQEEGILATQCVENQMVGEDNSLFFYQAEEQEKDQSVCQMLLEDNPDQPGTYKVSFIQVTGTE